MTKPEIIKQLKIELSVWESDCKSHHKTKDALKAAIERLEQDTVSRETYESEYLARKQDEYELWKIKQQEPCDDAVSRQTIDQNIYDFAESNKLSYANMKNYILDVPPVTPARKKGKWKKEYFGAMYDTCSECGRRVTSGYFEFNYCPNCGAEMESEE